jgi:hypothetical protein
LAAGQLDADSGVVLREVDHFDGVMNRNRQLADPASEDALDMVLP